MVMVKRENRKLHCMFSPVQCPCIVMAHSHVYIPLA